MTTEQLRYFITVVNTGSYMEAALELNISQSTVSKQIQIFERELGISLFDRSFRKAKLTPEGQKLLPEARQLLEKIDHFYYSASELWPDHTGHFTVVTLPVVGFLNLYAPLNLFESTHPNLHLEVIEMEEPQLRKHLSSGDFDLAITYEQELTESGTGWRYFPIAADEAVFAVHRNHPLACRESVTVADIADTPLFLMGEHTCLSKLCDQYFAERSYSPNVIFRGMPETLIAGVKAQRGCAVISQKQALSFAADEISTIPFAPSIPMCIGAIPNDSSPRREQIYQLLSLLTHQEQPLH